MHLPSDHDGVGLGSFWKAFDQIARDRVFFRRRQSGAGGDHHGDDVAPFRGGVIGIEDAREVVTTGALRRDDRLPGAFGQIERCRFRVLRRRSRHGAQNEQSRDWYWFHVTAPLPFKGFYCVAASCSAK